MVTIPLFALPPAFLQTVSTWLLHSLWMGLVLALLTAVVMSATARSKARVRYNLLLACFALFFTGMLIVLFWQLTNDGSAHHITAVTLQQTSTIATPVLTGGGNYTDDVTASIIGFTQEHSLVIVGIWMFVILIRSVRLAGGLYSMYLMKNRHNEPVPAEWNAALQRLQTKLGIKTSVNLLASWSVTVPVVIGHLRPVILLPVQLVTSLPVSQLEPILLHELAHIFRKDFIVNLVMTTLETLFFFNPAVIWVAALIRRERENCCDDLTIEHTGATTEYIEALLCCQQLQQESPMLVPALMGKPKHLLMRVKRMLYNDNRTLNNMEKSIITISLVTTALLALAFTGRPASEGDNTITPMPVQITTSATETTCTTVETLSANHYFLFNDAADTVPAPPTVPAATSQLPPSMQVPHTPAVPAAAPAADAELMHAPVAPAAPAAPMPASKQRLKNLAAPASLLNEKLSPQQPLPPAGPAFPAKESLPPDAAMAPSFSNRNCAPAPPPPPLPYAEMDAKQQPLLKDLVADGIINKGFSQLSFKLSTTEFIVNGKRQPKEVFEKYRRKYVGSDNQSDWSWYYNYDTETVVK